MSGFISTTPAEREAMLARIGVASLDDLFRDVPSAHYRPTLDLPPGLSEMETWRYLRDLSGTNLDLDRHPSFLGAGAYRHYAPAAIGHLLSRTEFLTSYTPYQPEVSQGTLQAVYEWQSMVCALTGMDVSNASVYDAGTGVGEAARMACALTRRRRVLVLDTVNPYYRDVLATYACGPDIEVETVPAWRRRGDGALQRVTDFSGVIDGGVACLIVQQPNFLGWLEQVEGLAAALAAVGAILVVVADPVSLAVVRPPGDYGAGIVVAEGKWTGGPTDFGGPLVGMFACRRDYVRQMPGRIVGATVDADGRKGYVLTLATREQHIRREKATSNICTSEALIALATTVYLSHLGPQGLQEIATQSIAKARYLASAVGTIPGFEVMPDAPWLYEVPIRCPLPAAEVNRILLDHGIVGGYDLGQYSPDLTDALLLCCTEATPRADIDRLVSVLRSLSSTATSRAASGALMEASR